MPVIGYVGFKNTYIKKHKWTDRLGGPCVSYSLKITKDDFESLLEDGLPAKHNEKTGEYFINIIPISKEGPGTTILEESAFVERDDIDCIFDIVDFTIAGKTFRKLYLSEEGIKKHVTEGEE